MLVLSFSFAALLEFVLLLLTVKLFILSVVEIGWKDVEIEGDDADDDIDLEEVEDEEDDKIGDSGIFGVDVFIIPPLLTVFCSVLGWFGWFGNLE